MSQDLLTTEIYLLYLGVASVVVFGMYAYDKRKAVANEWRVPEANLLVGTMASPVGAFAGMVIPWHKVRKPKFWGVLCISLGIHLYVLMRTMKMVWGRRGVWFMEAWLVDDELSSPSR